MDTPYAVIPQGDHKQEHANENIPVEDIAP
jgi:hypothetical protein